MSGYGKYINQGSGGRMYYVRTADNPGEAREAAAELLAWADEHDTVTITIKKNTATYYAGAETGYFAAETPGGNVRLACRKALGVEK